MTYDIEAQVRRRTRRVVGIAAVVVAAVVAAAVFAVLALRGDRDTASPMPAPLTPPPSTATADPTGTPPARPGDLGPVTWADVRGMAVPVSAKYGPASRDGGRAARFTHDRPGAVLAAAHIAPRAEAIVGPAVYRPTIRDQVTGTDAEALLTNVESDYEQRRAKAGVPAGDPLPETHAEIAGYRIDSYNDQSAFLRLLIASPGPNAQGTVYVDFRLEVRWSGQDWRLVAPPGGEWRSSTGQVAGKDGYTLFPRR